ncbi:MAG: sel1 repeat family protein, partial [Chlorobiaceae bacterium]|nr:sel1 repeat family protein [Chlorobiaceae bacterium]
MKRHVISLLLSMLMLAPLNAQCGQTPDNSAPKESGWRLFVTQSVGYGECVVGLMYQGGKGVKQDYAQALKWFRLSSARGNPWAQYFIALMYDNGRGVPKSRAKAKAWYKKSADNGLSEGKEAYERVS